MGAIILMVCYVNVSNRNKGRVSWCRIMGRGVTWNERGGAFENMGARLRIGWHVVTSGSVLFTFL